MKKLALALLASLTMSGMAMAEEQRVTATNRIDIIRPDAPVLAMQGDLPVGMRTIEATNPGQLDINSMVEGTRPGTYDRTLTLEIWYPAAEDTGTEGSFETLLRDGQTTAIIHGRAVRDAEPAQTGPYPLVIISHGFPGNRFLLSHLAENLATKGYVVASIDHKDSTYADQGAFISTLVNRPLDDIFVLNTVAELGAAEDGFLSGLVDADHTGLVGYSMGAYGAVVTAGGSLTAATVASQPNNVLAIHQTGAAEIAARKHDRIKAFIAIAPWGRQRDMWDAEGLANITTPIFYVAGSVDGTSGYETGTRKIYEETVNAEHYLLTFANAGHNAAAPMPAPSESWAVSEKLGAAPFGHYADPVWDTVRMNNVLQHFATAFFGLHVKGDADMAPYLALSETAPQGNAADAPGAWLGFAPNTTNGLSLLQAKPVN